MPSEQKNSEKRESSSKEENGMFPPISSPRKHALRSNSSNDSDVVPESTDTSRNVSRDNSPCKLPSLSSQPQPTHHKERKHRESRRKKVCRSPSCPSLPNSRPETNDFETPPPHERHLINFTPNQYVHEYDVKLPNIFKTARGSGQSSEITDDGWSVKDRSRTKSNLRRTESTRENYVGSPTLESKINKNQQRSHTHTALLLPLRTHENRKSLPIKKKKSAFNRQSTYSEGQTLSLAVEDNGATNGYNGDYDSDYYDSPGQNSGSSFERILEESDSHMSIPSAGGSHISVPSANKQWLKQKEGQVKA